MFFIFYLVSSALALIYNSCETVDWVDSKLTSAGVCDKLQAGEHYQITDLGLANFNISFIKSDDTGPIAYYKNPLNIRADSLCSIIVNTNSTLSDISGSSKFKATFFITYKGMNRFYEKAIEVYIQRYIPDGNLNSLIVVNGVEYAYTQNHFWRKTQSHGGGGPIQTDIMVFNKYLIEWGEIDPSDILMQLRQQWLVCGSGYLFRSQNISFIFRNSSTNPVIISLKNFRLNTQIYQPYTALDYANLSLLSSAPVQAQQVISDFKFYNTPFRLNAAHQITAGYLNNTWVTNKGKFGLPYQISNRSSTIRANFSFIEVDYNTSTTKTACLNIIIRDDYNLETGLFNIGQNYSSAQIKICPWWTRSFAPVGSLFRTITFDQGQFLLYINPTSCSTNSSGCWSQYTFISQNNRLSLIDIDLMDFVDCIVVQYPVLFSHTIAAIRMGFFFYTGMGMFQFQQTSIEEGWNKQNMVISKQFYQALSSAIAIPNLSLFIRLVSLLRIIDDLSYYTYHFSRYDQYFGKVSALCWNLTNTKWMIPGLDEIYKEFNITYEIWLPKSSTINTPPKFILLDQNINFLKQTEDYFIGSVPISLLMFIFFGLLYRIFKRYGPTKKISKILIKFGNIGFLFVNLIGDNLQYLSFRCYNQHFQTQPIGGTAGFINIVCCNILLFIVIFFGATFSFILPEFMTQSQRFVLFQEFFYSHQTIFYFTTVSLLRIFTGAIHSQLSMFSIHQISLLFSIQFIHLVLLIFNKRIFKKKILFTCNIMQIIFKNFLHLLLFLQIVLDEIMYLPIHKNVVKKMSQTFFQVILIFCVLEVLIRNYPQSEDLRSIDEIQFRNTKNLEKLKNKTTVSQFSSCREHEFPSHEKVSKKKKIIVQCKKNRDGQVMLNSESSTVRKKKRIVRSKFKPQVQKQMTQCIQTQHRKKKIIIKAAKDTDFMEVLKGNHTLHVPISKSKTKIQRTITKSPL